MSRRHFLTAAVLASAMAFPMAGCSSTSDAKAGNKTITIVTSNDAPFAYKDSAGNLTGIDGEMLNWIAKEKGWTINVTTTDFATMIQTVVTKRADAVVDGMYITDARKKQVAFTDIWYYQGEGMIVPSNSTLTSRDQTAGKVIGVQTGTAFDAMAKSLNPKSIKYFNSQAELLKGIENQQVDVGFTDAAVVAWSLKQHPNNKIKLVTPYKPYYPGQIGAAVRKDDTALLADLNSGLADLKKSPDYLKILEKYGLTTDNVAK